MVKEMTHGMGDVWGWADGWIEGQWFETCLGLRINMEKILIKRINLKKKSNSSRECLKFRGTQGNLSSFVITE